jgi:hypothetical protein
MDNKTARERLRDREKDRECCAHTIGKIKAKSDRERACESKTEEERERERVTAYLQSPSDLRRSVS